MRLKKLYGLFPAELHIANRRDNTDVRYNAMKYHIETHLIVARAGAAVGHMIGLNSPGVFCHSHSLHHALCTHAERVSSILQHIAIHEVPDTVLIVVPCDIDHLE